MPRIPLAWLGRRHRHRHRHRPLHGEQTTGSRSSRNNLSPDVQDGDKKISGGLERSDVSNSSSDSMINAGSYSYGSCDGYSWRRARCALRAQSATLGESTAYQVAAEDGLDQSPQALQKLAKVSTPPRWGDLLDNGRRECLPSLLQPRYRSMGGLFHKERIVCLSYLLQPRYRTMSHHPTLPDSAEPQIKENDNSEQTQTEKDTGLPFRVEIGYTQELCQRIASEVGHMERRVLNFQNRYNRIVRPMLASRCLIAPHDLKHHSTVFLHRQTYKIVKCNPSYLSSFDIMAYEDGIRDDEEWKLFLQHLVDKRVYVIEDLDSTISTIETLMYDHGLKGPEDGTERNFYKGECDASYASDTKSARLSFIIWEGDKILYAQVYKDVSCTSATEAEAFAAFALLSKAVELNILKLLLCSDCKAICRILSGDLSIGLHHEHRDLYLMLRSMKRQFKKLIAMWKQRELMVFADDLAKASDSNIVSPIFLKKVWQSWSHHLKGLSLFRIERTEDTNKKIAKFAKTELDESYGKNENFIFFVEVEDRYKYDCLLGLNQAFRPNKLILSINDIEKSLVSKGSWRKMLRCVMRKSLGNAALSLSPFKLLPMICAWWLCLMLPSQKKLIIMKAHFM